jgi:glycosyltransferase involved in cell wall biosynthesis
MSASRGRRLLILAPFPPRLDADHGGGRALARLVLAHAERSRVALLSLRAPGEPEVDPAVVAACEWVEAVERMPVSHSFDVAWRERGRVADAVLGRPLWVASTRTREFRARLERRSADWQPDVVQAEVGVMGQYLRFVDRGAVRVLVEYDPGLRRATNAVAAGAWRRFGRAVAAAADAVVVFSREDLGVEKVVAPAGTVLEQIPLPWVEPAPALDPVGGQPPTVLFVGGFDHPPNADAARRLVRLLPELRQRRPDVVLALVGGGPPADLAGDGVVLAGRVPDVEPWLAAATVVAAPLALGGGIRFKVVEAMAAGKAVVGTPPAFEGLDVVPGEQALVAADDPALVDAIGGLLDDPERRRRLGAAARAWAEQLPSSAAIADAYDALYRRLERR